MWHEVAFSSTASARTLVNLVSKYLAEHQELLRDAEYQKMLIEILDIFVDVGWPEAIRLVYRLDELFR